MVLIDFAEAREILDSRGNPTVEVKIYLNDSSFAIASVPSGASRSVYEAYELRDADIARFHGMGVQHAIKNINEIISPRLKKMNPLEQENIDKLLIALDSTPNKGHLGGNATLAVSLAVARAGAKSINKPLWSYINDLLVKTQAKNAVNEPAILLPEKQRPVLPTPLFNIINAGKHAMSTVPYQEFMVVPHFAIRTEEKLRLASEITHSLGLLLEEKQIFYGIGDEGGFSAQYKNIDQVFEFITAAIKRAGHTLGKDIFLAIDVAADSIEKFNPAENVEYYKTLLQQYPIKIFEDPLPSIDTIAWSHLRTILHGFSSSIAGDDLVATNPERLIAAIKDKAVDYIIIKPNQVGTLTETLRTARIAKHHGVGLIAAHRSGETPDTFITDLAVGIGADYLKAGAPVRGERIAKYNRLTEIIGEGNWDYQDKKS